MARRRSFRFLAAAVSGQSHQREQGHWQRSAAHQQSDQYRLEDGGQHLAAKQNLSGSTIPSIPNQVGGAHRDQGHSRKARIPSHPNTGGGLTRRSFWREIESSPKGKERGALYPRPKNTEALRPTW